MIWYRQGLATSFFLDATNAAARVSHALAGQLLYAQYLGGIVGSPEELQ